MSEGFAKVIIGDSRRMAELENESVDLVVTSPPYWHLKDYGVQEQVGYNQTLHQYLKDLYKVWRECFRVLRPGTRLCINIGDQFLRSIIYGRYRIAPLHSEFISQCEKIGFDYMGSIIWQKKTTINTTGGATVMGSFPYPGGGIIEIDYEFILVFKKPGKRTIPTETKDASKLSIDEWKEYFSGHWNFPGERQVLHEAMFPEELPRRLIKMFTFLGETVLDPFLGSGTTLKVAVSLGRNGVGYEINEDFEKTITEKVGGESKPPIGDSKLEVLHREKPVEVEDSNYTPSIQDAKPVLEPKLFRFEKDRLYKVTGIADAETLVLDTRLTVKLLGVRIISRDAALEYLKRYVKGKQVTLKFDEEVKVEKETVYAYAYLKNRIFVNKEIIRRGLGLPAAYSFKHKQKFMEMVKPAAVLSQHLD